jgi:ABC-2 type transport system permease protein
MEGEAMPTKTRSLAPGRYFRLLLTFGRIGLAQEMSFRANFLVKMLVEVLWLSVLLLFYELIFRNMGANGTIASWDRNQYLFFVGCHYALSGIIEAFFLENCMRFAELVRTGELDMVLIQPIDEQFLVTCQRLDWSTLPNILQGTGVMTYALWAMNWTFDAGRLGTFLLLMLCGSAMAYSFLLMLSSLSVWLIRNQNLMEMWWLFSTLMRYPREIFAGPWGSPVGVFFTFVVPVLLVVSVPANVMVRAFDWWFVALTVAASMVLLVVSRWFFRHALRSYRSASS